MLDRDLTRLFGGASGDPRPQFDGPQEGRVLRVDGAVVFFTLPDWSEQRVFGPAVWAAHTTVDVSGGSGGEAYSAHHHDVKAPVVGDWCLVLFVGAGSDRPWIVAWSSTAPWR